MARSYVKSRQGSDRDEMDRSSKKQDDDGREFVICRFVARDFKPRREGRLVRGEATAGGKERIESMRSLQACARRDVEQGQDEEKHMFTDVKQAHFIAKCDQERMGRNCRTNSRVRRGSAQMGE